MSFQKKTSKNRYEGTLAFLRFFFPENFSLEVEFFEIVVS